MRKGQTASRASGRASRFEVDLSNALQSAERAAATWRKSEMEIVSAKQAVNEGLTQLNALENYKSGLRGAERQRALATAEVELGERKARLEQITGNRLRLASCLISIRASVQAYDQIWRELYARVEADLHSQVDACLNFSLHPAERAELSRHPALTALDPIALIEPAPDETSPLTNRQIDGALKELRDKSPLLVQAIREHAGLFEREVFDHETDSPLALTA